MLALSLACQLALVAIAAYPMLGCELPVPPGDDGDCADTTVPLFPGGCTYITSLLAPICGATIWDSRKGSMFSILDHKDEFYVLGGAATGSDTDVAICAVKDVPTYDVPESVAGQVEYDAVDGSRTSAGADLLVTIRTDFACDRFLCVGVALSRTGPNRATLFGLPGGFDTQLWTADRSPSGIPEGQEDDLNVQVTFTEDTVYTLTVTGLDAYGVMRTASYSVLAEFQGGAAPIAFDDVGIYAVEEGGTLEVDSSSGVLANDSDPDTPLAVFVNNYSVPTQGGDVSLNFDGSFTYTAPPGFNGYDTFTYTISDGLSTSNEATVEITVGTPPNEPPEAEPDSYIAFEDTTLVVEAADGVLENDTDREGARLTVEVLTTTPDGVLVLAEDGSFTYTPKQDFDETDSFTYQVSDGTATTGPVPVTITVTPVNDPPIANAGADINIRVDRDVQGDGSGSSDPDAGPSPLTYQWTFVPPLPDGSALGDSDIALATTPTPRFTPDVVGRYELLLQVSDGEDSATDQVSVIAGNSAPTAFGEAYSVDEDNALNVAAPGVLANDRDPEDDPISVALVSGPGNGTLDLRADGSFDYQPAADFNGGDSFVYRASDGDLDSIDATVTITVNPINDAPTAAPDAYASDEDVALDVPIATGVLENDGDVDSDLLTVTHVAGSGPANGALTLNPDGSFQYVPNPNFNGTDGFSYTASDGAETTAPTAVAITVAPVADPPLALAGGDLEIRVDRLVVLDGSASSDPDSGAPLASFVWTFVSVPAGSALTNADIAGATTALASFTPDVAGTFTLELTVSNAIESATDQVDVIAGNDAPVALADAYEVDEDGSLTVPVPGVLANDSDPQDDPIGAVLVSDVSNGTLVFNPDGSFTYTPNGEFNGSDGFGYAASDGDLVGAPAVVTLTVRPVNDPPGASPDAYDVDEDTTLTVAAATGVLANDADPDGDVLGATLVSDVANGSLSLAADGSFVYTPADDFNGSDSFSYAASDGTDSTSPTVVTLNVAAVNDAPLANAGPDLDEGVGRTVPLDGTGSSDIDGDPLTYAWSFAAVPPGSAATITDPTSASASFVPDISGQYTVQLIVNDGTVDSAPDTAVFLITFCSPLTVRWVPNASGQWTEPTNWSTGLVPGPADDACIDVPADITVTKSTGASDSIRSLVSNEHIVLSNGSLSIAMPSVIYQTFTQSGGTLTGTGNLTVQGLLVWSGGTQSGTGQTIGNGGMSLEVGTKTLSGRTLVNPVGRTVSWSAGAIASGDGAVFVNNGTFRTTFDGGFVYNLGGVRALFTNNGTLEKTAGAGTTQLGFTLDNTASGVIRASSGVLELNGGGASAGRFEGSATLVFGGGTTDVNGVVAMAGATRIETSAVVNFNAPATVTNLGTLTIASGTTNFSNTAEAVAAALVHTGGDLVGPGTLRVTGPLTWNGGTQSGTGQTIGAGGMTLATSGAKWISGRTIVNPVGQTATWSAGQINSGNGGVFVNDGTFHATFDGSFAYNLGGVRAVFRNVGTLEKTAGTGRTQLSFTLDNTATGVVRGSSGLLEFNGGGTSAGRVEGAGTIVFGGGTTDVSGTYEVGGGTTIETSAVLNLNAPATVTNLGTLTIASGTANFDNLTQAIASSLVQSGGVVTGPGALRVTGSMTWSGGTQSGAGQTIGAGGMTLSGTASKTLSGRTVVNAVGQTATWSAGAINSGQGGAIVIDGTLQTTFDGSFIYNLGGVRAVLRNNGTFEKTGGTGATSLTATLENTATGVVRASSGVLELNAGGSSAGRFEGSATLVFGGLTMDVTGVHDVAGTTRVEGGSTFVNFNPPATVANLATLNLVAGTLNFSTGTPIGVGTIVQTGGTLTGTDTVTVAGSIGWSGGTQSGPGQTIGNGGMAFTGSGRSISGRTIVNPVGQTVDWTAGPINSGDGGAFVNGGTFRIAFDGQGAFSLGGARTAFTNTGTFEKTGGTGTSGIGFVFGNTGLVRSAAGDLSFTGGYTQTAGTTELAGGTFNGLGSGIQGGSLIGSGSVTGGLASTGTIAPASSGPLAVTGTFAQSGAGALEIELAGTGTPGTDYDQLTVSQAATLGGALNVSLANGFTPASGDSFVIMTYSSATGAFASQSLPPLGGGLSWNVSVGANAITLSVVP
jgi:hypothetical protein